MGYNLTQINPAYELVSDIVVGTATTSVDFTGLNFGKTDDLILSITSYSSINGEFYFYTNGNTTNTNYYTQQLNANSTSVVSSRMNSPRLFYNASSRTSYIKANIKLTNNSYVTALVSENRYASVGTDLQIADNNITSTFTATSITSLTVTSQSANGIGIGSRFQLYKRVAPIVFDYEVTGSATTQVDITGLNIDKTGEYQLVSTLVNNSGSAMSYFGYYNSNTIDTNYYFQYLAAGGTGISGARSNANFIAYVGSTSQSIFSLQDVKLTNNSYITNQHNSIEAIGTSSISIRKSYASSTFTATSITSLHIKSSATNGIGIGSRFQLIKLK